MTTRHLTLSHAVTCAFAALALLTLGTAARAQWVPCDPNGNAIPHPYTDNNGCYPMYGTLSGNGSGSQTPSGVPAWPKSLYTIYPSSAITYDPYNDDDTGTATGVEAYDGTVNDPDSDTTTYVSSSANVTCNYSWTAYFLWTGQSPPPPGPASFLLITTVAAAASHSTNVSPTPSGLSGTATTNDQYGESESASVGAAYVNNVGGGRHLVQVSTQGGMATVTLSGTVTAQAANSSTAFDYYGYPVFAAASGAVEGGVKPDTRSVTISCPSLEPSYSKGADDATGAGYQIPHPPGSFQADSVVSWNATDAEWTAGPYSFNGYASNFTDPTCSWSLSGAGSPSTTTQGFLNSPSSGSVGSGGAIGGIPVQLFFSSASFPQTSTVNLNVTDGPGTDGASGSGSYNVTWHLPYEATTLYNTTHTKHTVGDPRVGPVAPGATTLVQASDPQSIDVSAVFDAGATVTAEDPEVAGLFAIASSVAKITDAKYSYGGEASYNGASNTPGSGNWSLAANDMNEIYQGAPNINTPTLASDSTNQDLCYLYIYVVENDTDRYWYADGYNTHGFDGNSQHTIDVHQCDLVESEPYFKQYKTANGGPYTD